MVDDPFPGYGLRPVELADRPTFDAHLQSLAQPLSDYTFSQIFTWRNSLRLLWKPVRDHLCVFANGTGDLTLLLPPIGSGNGGGDAALAEAFELMDAYNAAHRLPLATASRVEYASEELLARFDRHRLDVVPMGTDYVYDVQRMIDLAGGDLKSKRQERNRFTRDVVHRVETYDPARHFDACCALLTQWRTHQDGKHLDEAGIDSLKRHKESIATDLALRHAADLGLTGMVVYVTDPATGAEAVRGFTFGEPLGTDQSSIVIEKTDLEVKGLAQFIFSEFCRLHWSHRPRVNAGDDWGLDNLKWTKTSYRPVALLPKYGFRRTTAAVAACGVADQEPPVAASAMPQAAVVAPRPEPVIRPARKNDLPAAATL
ncbi:MAG TPA: phosphatidylglycerol lysyltransferase domain-containing protein, partial [Tepidisphaeraceae bacterium]|nr:phosphatidylglycerol lysyltransferase domain-containing protein [Tepidisphaeraceae bacterium]